MSRIYKDDTIGVKPSSGTGGDIGPPGPPNVLTIGTVETLAPGTPATAEITGDSPNQVLSLGIPQGEKGEPGDAGGGSGGVVIPEMGGPGDTGLFLHKSSSTAKNPGALLNGSSILYAGLGSDAGVPTDVVTQPSGSPAGTWRVQGLFVTSSVSESGITVCLRVDTETAIRSGLSQGDVRNCQHVPASATRETAVIDCEVMLNGEWVPFTASPHDPAPHGRKIYEAAIAGQYGKIASPEEDHENQ